MYSLVCGLHREGCTWRGIFECVRIKGYRVNWMFIFELLYGMVCNIKRVGRKGLRSCQIKESGPKIKDMFSFVVLGTIHEPGIG